MTRSYTDELGDWIKKRETRGRARNLVAFHGVRDDVKAAIDAGYPAKTIWSNLQESGRIGFGYESFLNYVNGLVRKTQGARPGTLSGESVMAAAAAAALLEPPAIRSAAPNRLSARGTGMPTFKFNPVPANRQDAA